MRKGVLLLLTLALVACGGGGGGGPSPTIAPAVRDQLAADAAVLQLSDLPRQFAALGSESSSDQAPLSDPNQCIDPPPTQGAAMPELVVTARAHRQYAIGLRLDAVIVRGTVEVFRDAESAAGKAAEFGRPEVIDCLEALYVQQLTALGGAVGEVTASPSKVEGLGDEQTGFVLSFVAALNGVEYPFAFEFDFTRVNRAGVTVSVLSPRGIDHALATSAMTPMVNRLQQ